MKLYTAWVNMKHRGQVCERWNSFDNFAADMKATYKPHLTLERINKDYDYEPINCRWSTWRQQARNNSRNRLITYMGVTKTMIEWSEDTGINYSTLRMRLNRWSVEEALTK